MGTFDEVKKKADDLMDQAKSTVGGLADQQGDKVAKAVDKLTDTFDDKTGGSASAVQRKLTRSWLAPWTRRRPPPARWSQKASEATNAVKGAVSRSRKRPERRSGQHSGRFPAHDAAAHPGTRHGAAGELETLRAAALKQWTGRVTAHRGSGFWRRGVSRIEDRIGRWTVSAGPSATGPP